MITVYKEAKMIRDQRKVRSDDGMDRIRALHIDIMEVFHPFTVVDDKVNHIITRYLDSNWIKP